MRVRVLAMALALLFFACAHASEAYVVQVGGMCALVDADGRTLLTNDDANGAYEVGESGLFAVSRADGCALYDAFGERIGAARFEEIYEAAGVLIFRENGRYGAMDKAGEVIVPAQWRQLVPNGEGAYLALDDSPIDEQPDAVFCLEPGAEPVDTGTMTANGLRAPSCGRMAYMAPGGRYGYLDARGRAAIPEVWRHAGDFQDGVAIVCGEDGFGAIDADGSEVIPPAYRWMARGAGLIAAMTAEGGVDVYSADGATLLYAVEGVVEQVGVVGNCVAVTTGDQTQLYDARGACILRTSADAVFAAGFDGQMIVSDGEWGEACQWLIGPDGAAVSSKYQRILPLLPGRYAFLTMRGTEYYSEALSSNQISWDYESVRYGLMDASGREIAPADCLEIRAMGDDRLLMRTEDVLIFADPDGRALRQWLMAEGE